MSGSQPVHLPVIFFKRSLHIPSGIFSGNVRSLVIEFLALRDTDLTLCQASFEINLKRNNRISLLRDRAKKFADFSLVKQQNCRQEYASILICESREAPV
jgi:hypothetical protein